MSEIKFLPLILRIRQCERSLFLSSRCPSLFPVLLRPSTSSSPFPSASCCCNLLMAPNRSSTCCHGNLYAITCCCCFSINDKSGWKLVLWNMASRCCPVGYRDGCWCGSCIANAGMDGWGAPPEPMGNAADIGLEAADEGGGMETTPLQAGGRWACRGL